MANIQHIAPDGKAYELPKMTIKVAEALDDAAKDGTIAEKAGRMFDTLSIILGEDYMHAYIGKDVSDADLVELANTYVKVDATYSDALSEASDRALQEKIDAAKGIINQIGDISEAVEVAKAFNRANGVRG